MTSDSYWRRNKPACQALCNLPQHYLCDLVLFLILDNTNSRLLPFLPAPIHTKRSMPSHKNPVLSGFNPDPSIVRVGEDFFLVTSTFEYFPGLPIYHSKDVTQWTLIGHALTRRSQLEMRTAEPGSGVWAPTIRFHKGKFYIATCSFTAYTPQQKVSDHPRTLQVLCYGQDMNPIKKKHSFELGREASTSRQRIYGARRAGQIQSTLTNQGLIKMSVLPCQHVLYLPQ